MKGYLKQLLLILILYSINTIGQEKITLSGTVYDKNTNETLIGVTVYLPELNYGTMTNEYGFYSVTVPKGNYKLQVSYVGYATISENINLSSRLSKDYKLVEESESLDEVIIETNVEKLNIRTPQMSVNSLSAATIKQIRSEERRVGKECRSRWSP